jgi:hypothetical protein
MNTSDALDEFGISFVLLEPIESPKPSVDEGETHRRAATALDGNAALAPVGDTAYGRLWRHEPATDAARFGVIPPDAGGPIGTVSLLVIAIVFGAALLLSIPTGAGSEAVRQANREAIRRAAKAEANAKASARAVARDKGRGRRRRPRPGDAGSAEKTEAAEVPVLVGADAPADDDKRDVKPEETTHGH